MEIIIKCSDDCRGSQNVYGEPIKELVRCGECKWWKCADDTEIIKYGDCTHPYSAIRKNCLPNETWYCADGERETNGDC
jgi:hypothetical protein